MQLISSFLFALAASSVHARGTPLRARQDEPAHTYQPCGGFVPNPPKCDEGFVCIQDPRDDSGVTDQPGICVPEENWPKCGGISGLECLPGWGPTVCYDWPQDDCDPDNGGADCIGICLYPL